MCVLQSHSHENHNEAHFDATGQSQWRIVRLDPTPRWRLSLNGLACKQISIEPGERHLCPRRGKSNQNIQSECRGPPFARVSLYPGFNGKSGL